MPYLRALARLYMHVYTTPRILVAIGIASLGASLPEAVWSREMLKDFIAHLAGIVVLVLVLHVAYEDPFVAELLIRRYVRIVVGLGVLVAAVGASILELILRRQTLSRFFAHFLAFPLAIAVLID